MTFTKDQMEALAPFEEYFRTAVGANWARNPGRENLSRIHGILKSATGDNRRLDANCQHCIVNLLRDTGKAYFADKAEIELKKSEPKKVVCVTEEVPELVIKHIPVKTTGKKKKK